MYLKFVYVSYSRANNLRIHKCKHTCHSLLQKLSGILRLNMAWLVKASLFFFTQDGDRCGFDRHEKVVLLLRKRLFRVNKACIAYELCKINSSFMGIFKNIPFDDTL